MLKELGVLFAFVGGLLHGRQSTAEFVRRCKLLHSKTLILYLGNMEDCFSLKLEGRRWILQTSHFSTTLRYHLTFTTLLAAY